MHDDRREMIDDEIDAVARSLTAAAPSPTVRFTIRRRLAVPASGRRAVAWSFGLAAAAAVIVLALLLDDRQPPADIAAAPEDVAVAVPPAAIEPAIEPFIEPRPTPPRAAANRALLADEPPIEIEMLDVEPLELEPLDVPLLAFEEWDVAPLALQQ